jgi:hypothetical protein
MDRKHKEGITRFVKEILGCQCPDEVFEHIEWEPMEPLRDMGAQSLILGKRLLLFIWETNDVSLIRSNLPAMLSFGRRERDRRKLKRFRTVIATDDVDGLGSFACTLFDHATELDERVHLHVVHVKEVAAICDGR